MKVTSLIIFFFSCILALCCKHAHNNKHLQEGDLLFQDLNCGELCDAIESVTEGVNGKDFSHCGVVVNINGTLMVAEAISEKVQFNSLQNFFSRSGDTIEIENITVGRLKTPYESLIPKVISNIKEIVGQPYDDVFLLNNGKWYCSELIYETFKNANNQNDFFELEPMTFKSPINKSFIPAWVGYYKDLGQEIPEGELGTNPGLISRSDKIEIVEIKSIE
jgi:hypothetical protein